MASARKGAGRTALARPSPHPKHVSWPHPLALNAILSPTDAFIKTDNTHLVPGDGHQRGVQRKREPSGVRPQKLPRCSGRETPSIEGRLEQHWWICQAFTVK